MNISDLQTAVSELGKVLELCGKRIRPGGAPVVRVLCEFYAIKVASKVLAGLGKLDGMEFEINHAHDEAEDRFGANIELPTYAAFQGVAQQLRVALASNERDGIVAALQEIGVFALCSDTTRQFARLERRIGSVIGRAQVIPLVELSIFALELGQIERSGKYASEAHALGPGASEQHDLYTVEGVIALHRGNIAEAKSYLAQSVEACITDEFACLACGVRAPNMALADKLMDFGGQQDVIGFLVRCQDVWDMHRGQFDSWIEVIRSSGRPDFRPAGVLALLNGPSFKLRTQSTLASHIDENPPTSAPKSKADALEARTKLRAEYKDFMREVVKGGLGISNN